MSVQAVAANGGAFAFDVPAVSYYLVYWLDLNGDGATSVGEPFELYNDRVAFPGDPLAVPQSDLGLDFDDTGRFSGISGTITYTGALGPVSASRTLCVCLFPDANIELPLGCLVLRSNPAHYDAVTFDTRTYYLLAFLDLDGDEALGFREPYEIYRDRTLPPGDPVAAGPIQTAVDFTFADESLEPQATPSQVPTALPTATLTRTSPLTRTPTATRTPTLTRTPTASRTPTPTPHPTAVATPTPTMTPLACVGDCDGSGEVTINEVITMVNIALGSAAVSACNVGDKDASGSIEINEIITAVNNAAIGCVATA